MIFQYVKRLKAPIENILTIELSKGNKGKDRGHIHKVKRLSKQTKYCEISLVFFVCPFEKTGRIMGTPAAGGRAGDIHRLSALLSGRVFIRSLSNLVNMLVGIISWLKFYNQRNSPRHSWFMAFELSKNLISGICSLSGISCSKKCCHYHWIYHKTDWPILCQFGTLVFGLFQNNLCRLIQNRICNLP